MKIHVGDRVIVTSGRDRGREGKVVTSLPDEYRVVVEGVNKYVRHTKPKGKDQPGKREDRERPIHLAHVMLLCPKCGQPTRVGFTMNTEGKKMRRCKECKKEID